MRSPRIPISSINQGISSAFTDAGTRDYTIVVGLFRTYCHAECYFAKERPGLHSMNALGHCTQNCSWSSPYSPTRPYDCSRDWGGFLGSRPGQTWSRCDLSNEPSRMLTIRDARHRVHVDLRRTFDSSSRANSFLNRSSCDIRLAVCSCVSGGNPTNGVRTWPLSHLRSGNFSLVSYQRFRQEPTNSLTYLQISRPNDHELAFRKGRTG